MRESEFIILVLLIFFSVIIILPIIILSQVNSLKNEVRNLYKRIDELLIYKSQQSIQTEKEVSEIKKVEEVQITSDIVVKSIGEVEKVSEVEQILPEITCRETVYTQPDVREEIIITPPKTKIVDERNILEKLLGTNWLSKIGIVTLVLGIGFFVKYAIDKEWINEIGRVAIGLLTGGIIIGIAHKLKSKYNVFSSILVGGGISVFYITITLAFREYQLFGQTLSFALLIVTTIFSVLLSILYDRKELAVFSLLGGFASPLMVSTGMGNFVILFSYILILNTGMLIVSYIKKWRITGIICYILTLAFLWIWLINPYKNELFNVSLFITLFFIQFYILALFDHIKTENKVSPYQVFLILTNNLSAFFAFIYVFNNYSFDIRGLITISFAVINAIVLILLFRNSRIDRNLKYLIIAIVLSFVSLAIPVQLKGHVITLFWAAESVILLFMWQKSQIKVFFAGFIFISFLVLFSYLLDIRNLYLYSIYNTDAIPFLANREFITGIVVIAAFVINRLLLKRETVIKDSNKLLVRFFALIIIAFAFIVPFIEIHVQLTHSVVINVSESFKYVALANFTVIYIAILGIIYNKKIPSKNFIFELLYIFLFIFTIIYTFIVAEFRFEIFKNIENIYPSGSFSIHLFSLPAIAYIVYLLIKNIKTRNVLLSWMLTVLSVVILSVETDNIVVWISGNSGNYYNVLYDVHTFGYPILWGIIAMALMIWGLNCKEALLRKISIVFFGFIIVKFYVYDVWKMSQSGRVISFVILGVILLLVSFLQQKIRTLVKNDKEIENNEQNEINP